LLRFAYRVLLFCLPLSFVFYAKSAWAWGPVAHLYFGLGALSRLEEVSDLFRALLASQPLPFLYGSLGADIFLMKKLGRSKTHSHNWANGLRLVQEARSPRVRSFALGYVSHLAADTISHNCFVPSKTVQSYASGISRHISWELMFDRRLADQEVIRVLREVSKEEFSDCDAHLAERVPTRILDFSFNREVFRRLLSIQTLDRWGSLWNRVGRKGWLRLQDREVGEYTDRSIAAVLSCLNPQSDSQVLKLDPVGRQRLRAAGKLRRSYRMQLRRNAPPQTSRVLEAAERFAREPFHVIQADDHR
jgi:hypothetical protein